MNKSITTRWAVTAFALPAVFGASWVLSGCKGSDTASNPPPTDVSAPPIQQPAPPSGDTTSANAPSGDFADAAALWTEVMAASVDLDKTIAAKDMEGVHHKAFALRDKAKMLTGKSASLSSDGLASLEKGLGTVVSLAAQLDEAGDANKQADAESLNLKVHGVLDAIKAIYPAGALK